MTTNNNIDSMDKGELAEEVVKLFAAASPDQLNRFTTMLMRRGGKYAFLARMLTSQASVDDPEYEQYKMDD